MGTDREARLEAALIRVRAHTAWTYPQGGDTVGLLAGLLRAIEMIVDAALSTPPEATPEPPTPEPERPAEPER